ncbi:hypothetical protein AYO20_10043 [Fonsecaea nubica]|uniref:RRM domain-containing protein n=1 Tax=Fonsecaea nubica TaxID=856822 RepID=A0A178C9H3_9EURO|nr:hypothetical protein AYO20_10043 [Fonsecaea nubica]OAL26619.1 hypothetical protein AYO20_10043 [Fonsecaea nubica]
MDTVGREARAEARRGAGVQVASSKIVVEKLSRNVTEAHLREIFGSYGRIESIDLPLNKQFMTNRGTAYILYDHPSGSESAIAHMHEAQLDGVVISEASAVTIILQILISDTASKTWSTRSKPTTAQKTQPKLQLSEQLQSQQEQEQESVKEQTKIWGKKMN